MGYDAKATAISPLSTLPVRQRYERRQQNHNVFIGCVLFTLKIGLNITVEQW